LEGGVEVKHKKGVWRYVMQINRTEEHSPLIGEKQVAYLVFCKGASSVPRSEWERCCSTRAFPELALYDCEQGSVLKK